MMSNILSMKALKCDFLYSVNDVHYQTMISTLHDIQMLSFENIFLVIQRNKILI